MYVTGLTPDCAYDVFMEAMKQFGMNPATFRSFLDFFLIKNRSCRIDYSSRSPEQRRRSEHAVRLCSILHEGGLSSCA